MRCRLSIHRTWLHSTRSAGADRMTTWFERLLRRVFRSPPTDGSALPPGRRPIEWRRKTSTRGDQPEYDDTESFADTLPMAVDSGGWMLSSMDFMTGVEVLESDKHDPDFPPSPDATPVRAQPPSRTREGS